jgi:hypothetical protein
MDRIWPMRITVATLHNWSDGQVKLTHLQRLCCALTHDGAEHSCWNKNACRTESCELSAGWHALGIENAKITIRSRTWAARASRAAHCSVGFVLIKIP